MIIAICVDCGALFSDSPQGGKFTSSSNFNNFLSEFMERTGENPYCLSNKAIRRTE